MISYSNFIRLYREAKNYKDDETMLANLHWQDWMNPYENRPERIAEIVSEVFEASKLSLAEVRKLKGFTRADLSRLFDIPARTLANWENGIARKEDDYLFMLIIYAILSEGGIDE